MYIDVKNTIWERIYLDDTAELDKVVRIIEDEGVFALIENTEIGYRHHELLIDTQTEMTTKENDGHNVIEIFDESYEELYSK